MPHHLKKKRSRISNKPQKSAALKTPAPAGRRQRRCLAYLLQPAVLTALLACTPAWCDSVDHPTDADADAAIRQYNPQLGGVYIAGLKDELAKAIAAHDLAKQVAYNDLIAQIYLDRGDDKQAAAYAQQAIAAWQKKPDNGNLHYAESLKAMGKVYRKAKRYDTAAAFFDRYRTYLTASQGSPEKIALATLWTCECYSGCGAKDKEIPLLSKSLLQQNQYAGNLHLVLATKLELAQAIWATYRLSAQTLNTQAGQTAVRLVREVANTSAPAGSRAAADVAKAQAYLHQLGIGPS